MSTSILPGERPDRLEEECAVFGVFAPGEDVARMTCFGRRRFSTAGRKARELPWGMARPLWLPRTWAWSHRCLTKRASLRSPALWQSAMPATPLPAPRRRGRPPSPYLGNRRDAHRPRAQRHAREHEQPACPPD